MKRLLTLTVACLLPPAALAQDGPQARADLQGIDGEDMEIVEFHETPNDLLVRVRATNLVGGARVPSARDR